MAVNMFEELVRAALNAQGYLTFENAAYGLNENARSLAAGDHAPNASDIDLIALHPRKLGRDRVLAVNCKGGAEPLHVERDIRRICERSEQRVAGASARKGFRELNDSDWAKAFRRCIGDITGAKAEFTHVTVVRTIVGDRTLWSENESFKRILKNPLMLWDFGDVTTKIMRSDRLNANNAALKLVDLFQRAA